MKPFFKELYHNSKFRWLILLSLLAFLPALGFVHLFDWDEINFAECAREMVVTGDYFRPQVNFAPFWEKPPLFFWLQAGSMHLFGVNEFAARFPNAICGVITVAVLYFMGKKEKDEKFGLIWGFLYLCAFLPQMYFRSAIIDPVLNLFIFLSAWYLFRGLKEPDKKLKMALLSGLFCGLAVLTKGPVGFILVFLTFGVYVLVNRFKVFPSIGQILIFALSVLVICFGWFGVELIKNGPWFIQEFIFYQYDLMGRGVAGHEQPFYYHFIVVFFGTFPLSALALPSLVKRKRETELERWFTILFWVVLILFSLVTTKIVHYSSMTYLPLSFLAATVIYKISWSELKTYVKVIYFFLASIYFILLIGLPLFAVFKDKFLPLFKDPFAVAGFSDPDVTWGGWEPFIVLFFLAGLVLFIWNWKKGELLKGLMYKALGLSIALNLTMIFVVSKIEYYAQGPMIEFLQDMKGKEVYVHPVGFKSYAPYFYFEQTGEINAFTKVREEKLNGELLTYTPMEKEVRSFLLYDPIEYDTWFITKINHIELDSMDHVNLEYTKGGFKFYKREATN